MSPSPPRLRQAALHPLLVLPPPQLLLPPLLLHRVLALPLREASLKVRTGGVKDEPEDVAAGVWAGVLPLRTTAGEVETEPDTSSPVPDDVAARAAHLRG